jgi:ferrochelatase
VVAEVQHRYALIGHSPLTEITLRQGQALARLLGLPVFVGMRNWKPFIGEAVRLMRTTGVERAVALCMAPQNSRTSVGLYRKAVETESAGLEVDFVEEWHDQPLLIAAFAEKLREGWKRARREAGTRVPVIFTAHSVPERTIVEGDPYAAQARETAELVVQQVQDLSSELVRFAFQSQGMSGGEWLGPTVEETLAALRQEGNTAVFMQPIGFLCDHVEVLYDVDILFRKVAAEQGMRLWRAESLNESPRLTEALAEVVRRRLGQPAVGAGNRVEPVAEDPGA